MNARAFLTVVAIVQGILLGALVEAAGDRALPERRRDTSGCGAADKADQRSASRRSRRRGGLPRAHGEHVAHPDGAGPTATARADRPGVLRGDVAPLAACRDQPSAETFAWRR